MSEVLGYRFTYIKDNGCKVQSVSITPPTNNYPEEKVENIRPLVDKDSKTTEGDTAE